MIKRVMVQAKENLSEDGQLVPVGLLCKDGETHPIVLRFETDKEKLASMMALGVMTKLQKIDYCFLVADGAMRMAPEGSNPEDIIKNGFPDGLNPTEVPLDDRRDVILCWGFDRSKNKSAIMLQEYRRQGRDMKTIEYKGVETPEPEEGEAIGKGIEYDFLHGYNNADRMDNTFMDGYETE